MLLLLKLFLVPMLVAGATVATRRWGLRIGGLLTALPLVAGPTLCFYAIERGNGFAASAARATLLGIIATAVFCVVYAHTARRVKWILSLLAGWSAFALTVALIYRLEFRGFGSLALAVTGLLVAQQLLPLPTSVRPASGYSGWDLPLRMVAAATLVLVLTSLAGVLGPQLSGILTAFPIATVVICVFTHTQCGSGSVASFFRGLIPGLHSFAFFCFVFSSVLGSLHLELLHAVVAALLVQFITQAFILWRMSHLPSPRLQNRVVG